MSEEVTEEFNEVDEENLVQLDISRMLYAVIKSIGGEARAPIEDILGTDVDEQLALSYDEATREMIFNLVPIDHTGVEVVSDES